MREFTVNSFQKASNKDLYNKIDSVLKDAKEAGVEKFFVVGYDFETRKLAIEIAKTYNNCFAIIGYHPT